MRLYACLHDTASTPVLACHLYHMIDHLMTLTAAPLTVGMNEVFDASIV